MKETRDSDDDSEDSSKPASWGNYGYSESEDNEGAKAKHKAKEVTELIKEARKEDGKNEEEKKDGDKELPYEPRKWPKIKTKYDNPDKFEGGWLNSVSYPDCSPITKEEEEEWRS